MADQVTLGIEKNTDSGPRPSVNQAQLTQLYMTDQDEDSLYANQILDVMFNSNPNDKLGFGIRIDERKKILQISGIVKDGEADRVGLRQNDIILAVNDENIGNDPQIGIDELKKCQESTEVMYIGITICRRIFDHIMIKVQRSGIEKCNGKYYFNQLDEDYNSPVFINEDNDMLLLKSNDDASTGESLWALCDETNTYYIGVSGDLMPPNDSWKVMKKVGKYPCPGLIFYNTQQQLVEIEEDKSDEEDKHETGNENEDENESKQNDNVAKSKIVQNAMDNPESLTRHSRVFKTIHTQRVLVGLDDVDDEEYDEDKYGELLEKYGESQKNVQDLQKLVKDMNVTFYEYWLKDKAQQKTNEKLSKMVDTLKQEIETLKKKISDTQ